MKYAFIEHHRWVWPISVQCRVLRVSVAGYREHLARRASRVGEVRQRRHLSDEALLVHIKAIHAEMRGSYGWPRYPSGQVTLNGEGRARMLVSTNKCVDTWTLLKSEPKTLLQRPSVAGGGILRNSRRE